VQPAVAIFRISGVRTVRPSSNQWLEIFSPPVRQSTPLDLRRVAPPSYPDGALARSGHGDFHHPALPLARLRERSLTLASPVDMSLGVSVPSMFPSQGSYQHGPPLLLRLRVPPVTRPHRSYAALRLPVHLRSRLRFPLPSTYLSGECFFFAEPHEHPHPCVRRRFGQPAPRAAGTLSQGVNGVSQVTGSSPLVRATVTHPARWTISSPRSCPVIVLLPSGK
jgi:hypothetical protein